MSKKYNYSDITSMAGQLKLISSQISDILNELQNEQYSHIGDNGDIWTGDIANTSKQTFEDLTTIPASAARPITLGSTIN